MFANSAIIVFGALCVNPEKLRSLMIGRHAVFSFRGVAWYKSFVIKNLKSNHNEDPNLRCHRYHLALHYVAYIVASVLYCSIYHCTSFEKNEIEKFGILIFDDLFIRDFRIIPEGENMSIQCK